MLFPGAWLTFLPWVNHDVMAGTYGPWANLAGEMVGAETNWVNRMWEFTEADGTDTR